MLFHSAVITPPAVRSPAATMADPASIRSTPTRTVAMRFPTSSCAFTAAVLRILTPSPGLGTQYGCQLKPHR